MLLPTALVAALGLAASTQALNIPRGTFKEYTSNGFPNRTTMQQELMIAEQAGGKLPGGNLPTNLSDASITAWQLIAFNELFEVAYFSAVLKNVTEGKKGYNLTRSEREIAVKVLEAVRAQEQQHALGALAILKANKAFAPSPCEYMAPVDNLTAAISIANTFTDVVLGALQGANVIFANDTAKDALTAVQIISSVIGQEGEQNGAYRGLLGRIPSSSPFLTAVPAQFAYSALQLFVVPGSCPFELGKIDLTIFPPMTVDGGPIAVVPPKNETLKFRADLSNSTHAKKYVGGDGKGLYATFVTGLQLPYSVEVTNVKWQDKTITFEAEFPYNATVAAGFSHAALTTNKNISSVAMVPDYTLAGPAVIQANNTY